MGTAQTRERTMGSWSQNRIYCRTAAGDRALQSTEKTLPSDYRRILQIVGKSAHPDVIRGFLRHIPDDLLGDWIGELQELGLLGAAPADGDDDLDFSYPSQPTRPSGSGPKPDDTGRTVREVRAAQEALDRAGAYLFQDRLKNRPALARKANAIRVLVVEDDPDQAALARLRASTAGYAVRVAFSFKELIEAVRGPLPDLLLLDVNLPDGDGFDILGRIRRHRKLALLPVVMLTARTDPEDVRRGLESGADGYITKPYSKNILTQTVRSVLKHA
ncbi:MAG: response regulator [Burkholderiales bacterium]